MGTRVLSRSEPGPGAGSSFASVGFLLVDSSGAVLSANAEALRILSRPAAVESQLEQTLREAVGALLAPNARLEPWRFTLLCSRECEYRCWGIPLVLEKGERQVAVLTQRAASKPCTPAGSRDAHDLTPREQETVTLLANGFTNKEIAARMRVSVNTVKVFMRSVMLKLGVTTRAGIVGRLFQGGTAAIRPGYRQLVQTD